MPGTRHASQLDPMRALAVAAAMASTLALGACHSSFPQPATGPQPENAFVTVPYPPPAARVEALPKRPSREAVWVDGQWSWDGTRWTWVPGAWVVPPPEGRFARWELRLLRDGQLLFARASWRDRSGRELPPVRVLAIAMGRKQNGTMPVRCP
jgi:hypothetical protein